MKPNKASNIVTFILGMGFNLALLAVVAYALFYFTQWGFTFGGEFASSMLEEGPDYEIIFVLEEDTPRAEVAQMLYQYELIANPWLFRLEMFLKNSTRVYRAGTYVLNRNMTNTDVNATLRRGTVPEALGHSRITVREGWTIRDMATYFEYREFFPAQEFIDYTQNGEFDFRFLEGVPDLPGRNRLEGYLFPDTYFLPHNPTPREIIIRMLIRFEQVMEGAWINRAYEMGHTLDDIIIMASIIEAEIRVPHERPMASQVIHNRLRRGMNLEMCSTVVYAMGIRRDRLTFADTRNTISPYNTYLNPGLPIGPIGNPGIASIEAALWPTTGNYLFFVLRDPATGEHSWNTTFAAHSAAAAQLGQELRQTDQ